MVVVLCASTLDAGAQSSVWYSSTLDTTSPSGRQAHSLAFDSTRGVAVLFGGVRSSTYSAETWEWNDSQWTLRAVAGPSARQVAAMAFDSARGVTVLFGGYTTAGESGETWEWNGSAWTQRAVVGPSARYAHAMVYDSDRRVTVLFGGRAIGNARSSETWEWNGVQWTLRSSGGPAARDYASMAYDSARHTTVLFGGNTGAGGVNGETWEWNGSAWSLRSSSGPAPRMSHAMTFDSARAVTVVFAGLTSASSNAGYVNDTWEWNGSAWAQRTSSGPSLRQNHAMAYDSVRQASIMFGGLLPGDNYSNETWVWTGYSWDRRIVAPPARQAHALAFDDARNVAVVFGGTSDSGPRSDTWEWNGLRWVERGVSGPSARQTSMVFDSSRSVGVLFGGYTGGGDNAETWEWSGAGAGTWTQRQVAGPSARFAHALAYDRDRHVTVLFGGWTSNQSVRSAETWEWDGSTWTLRAAAGPSARAYHAMAYDTARHVVVLFGGDTGSQTYSSETWEWNGATWTQRAIPGPSPRVGHAMAFDQLAGVTVLFGGYDSTGFNAETWVFDGAAWTQQAPGGAPTGRQNAPMTFDTARSRTLLCGGLSNGSVVSDLWEKCPLAATSNPLTALNSCPGASIVLSTSAVGATPITYTWRFNGLPLPNGPRPSGAIIAGSGSPVLSVSGIQASDAGVYDCVFTNPCGAAPTIATTIAVSTCFCGSPAIVQTPAQATVCPPGSASLSIQNLPGGQTPSAFQWRRDGVPITGGVQSDGLVLSDGTAATLSVIGIARGRTEGVFDCQLVYPCGTIAASGHSLNVPKTWMSLGVPPPGLPQAPAFVVEHDPDGPGGAAPMLLAGSGLDVGGTSVAPLARFDGAEWVPFLPQPPRSNLAGVVSGGPDLYAIANLAPGSQDFAILRFTAGAWTVIGSADNSLRGVAWIAGKAYAFGSFSQVNGVPAAGLAAFSPATGDWSSVHTSFQSATVEGVLLHNGELVVYGDIQLAGSPEPHRCVRWNGAAWESLGANRTPGARVVSWSGSLYSIGLPSGGSSTPVAMRWTGSEWQQVDAGQSQQWERFADLCATPTALYAVAQLSGYSSFLRLSGSRWLSVGHPSTGPDNLEVPSRLWPAQDGPIGTGSFTRQGDGQMAHIAQYKGGRWTRLGRPVQSGYFVSITDSVIFDNQRIVCGPFVEGDGTRHVVVARQTPAGYERLGAPFVPQYSWDDLAVRDIELHNGTTLYAAGRFVLPGSSGDNPDVLARWNGHSWEAVVDGTGPNGKLAGGAEGLLSAGGYLVVRGSFRYLPTDRYFSLLAYDGLDFIYLGDPVQSTPLGDYPGFANTMTNFRGRLEIGGVFDGFALPSGTVPCGSLAQRYSGVWHAADVASQPGSTVERLSPASSILFAAGRFSVPGLVVNGIAAYDGSAWSNPGGGASLGYVRQLVAYRDRPVAATYSGFFNGQVGIGPLISFDGTGWSAFDSSVVGSSPVPHVDSHGLWLSEVTAAGGIPVRGMADLASEGPPRLLGSTTPSSERMRLRSSVVMTAYCDDPLAAYQWQRETSPNSGVFVDVSDGPTPSGAVVSGATTPVLRLSRLEVVDARSARVRVSNACGSAFGPPHTLYYCGADFNCDGQHSVQDIFDFLVTWFNSDELADFDGDAAVGVSDIFAFLAAWFSGS